MSTLNAGETLQPFKPLRNNLIFDSSGNLVGIQNDRANGNDFRIGGGSGVDGTFATLVATTAIKINSGATLELYNTADQTTNYEKLAQRFTSNIAQVFTVKGGTGNVRALRLGVAGNSDLTAPDLAYLTFGTSVATPFVFSAGSTSTNGAVGNDLIVQTYGGTTGTQTAVRIAPTFNQSGTAGYTALDINPTETATGSGAKLLLRAANGGSRQASINNSGRLDAINIVSISALGFASAFDATIDVSLFRDAADTLALRRGPNAQTFRAYNTYTDASNYERGIFAWVGGSLFVGSEAAGTGTKRSTNISGSTVGISPFSGSTSTAWFWGTTGHYLAQTDNTYDIGAGGANRPRNLYMGSWLRMATTTVASLPAAATAGAGAYMFVTDANATTFASIVAGGGANTVPVYSDGTNWRIG